MPGVIRKNRTSSDGDEDVTRLAYQALQFLRLCYRWAQSSGRSTQLVSLSIYPPNSRHGGDWLIVGKAFDGGYRKVAFHRSPNPFTALLGFLQKCEQQTLTWKEDSYAQTSKEWLSR